MTLLLCSVATLLKDSRSHAMLSQSSWSYRQVGDPPRRVQWPGEWNRYRDTLSRVTGWALAEMAGLIARASHSGRTNLKTDNPNISSHVTCSPRCECPGALIRSRRGGWQIDLLKCLHGNRKEESSLLRFHAHKFYLPLPPPPPHSGDRARTSLGQLSGKDSPFSCVPKPPRPPPKKINGTTKLQIPKFAEKIFQCKLVQ